MHRRVAALAPCRGLAVRTNAGGVEIDVANSAYLPTSIPDSAKKLAMDQRVYLQLEPLGGCSIDPRDARIEVGHLEGWGRGLYNEFLFHVRSRGTVSRRSVSVPVRGKGRLRVRAKGLRVGEAVQEIAIE